MKVGIGSKNKAKIKACKNAFTTLKKKFQFNGDEIEFYSTVSETSIPDMPLNKNDLMKGALERALFVYEQFKDINSVDYAIGLEGGVYKEPGNIFEPNQAFLQSWIYVYNGQRGYFGCSPILTLPNLITHALYEEQKELAEVIDHFSGQQDVRSNEGAFGILTNELLTRSQSFYLGIINAMIPFLQKKYYPQNSRN